MTVADRAHVGTGAADKSAPAVDVVGHSAVCAWTARPAPTIAAGSLASTAVKLRGANSHATRLHNVIEH